MELSLEDKIRNLIAEEKVSVKEAVKAMIAVQYGYFHSSDIIAKTQTKEEVVDTPKPVAKKSIKYDPMFDPPPPFDSDPLPPRDERPGRVLAKANQACICQGCKSVVYITNKEVLDGMKVGEFIDAFAPVDGVAKLDRTTEIENIDGNIATDCPKCGSLKRLYLTGGPRV